MVRFVQNSARTILRRAALALTLVAAACGPVTLGGVGAGGPRVDTSAPVPVALLVPAGSGQAGDQALAQSLENAARLAIADLPPTVSVDLRVYQTQGNATVAAQVAQQAINDGAKILLGPVYAGAASAAGATAAGANVNVLAFSNNTDIAGGNVFVLGNTFEATADRLARYAVANGRGSVLVVHGQDAAETKGKDAIVNAVGASGGTIAGVVPFELSQNGVVQATSTIVDSYRSSGANALFLTSGTAGALPFLAQLLPEQGLGPEDAQFIGLQRWDIPATALELSGLQGGWFAVPDPALTQQFEQRYMTAYGEAPHPIAGLAYDGIAAIGALVGSGDSSALSGAALTQAQGFAGVNGVFRLRSDGSNERGLAIATIRDQQVVIVDPAPRSFGGAGF
ncbi:penicillin-binding protein activator [Anianabacter salinae]|uniref:penicillin-binding protein activator n=1 Tax=Anianabacter salinae TaxID=2851023 RepID=UPI00225DEA5B|nr:penicillin-binding protein activator [Anianabacter salinae]MBV0913961.1 penicillin-binding protein activator [Anianabacter salinae]